MIAQRIAYVHAGTHKTGTTSIQVMLAANAALLANQGIYIPRTGRLTAEAAGHHNIAWELSNPYRFDPNLGTLTELLDEVSAAALPTVCVSSEEFEFVAPDAPRLLALYDGFRAIGYEPRAILYLRPQADYLESLYAELIKGGWPVDFETFRSSIVTTGKHVWTEFDYDRLTRNFARVFGLERLRIRSYRAAAPADDLLAEFMRVLCEGREAIDINTLARPGRLNQRNNFEEVFQARRNQIAAASACAVSSVTAAANSEQFAPLSLLDAIEIAIRFWPSNARVGRRHGVNVPGVTWATLSREIVTALIGDRAGRKRKLTLRALREEVA